MTYPTRSRIRSASPAGKILGHFFIATLIIATSGCRFQRKTSKVSHTATERAFYLEFSARLGYQLNGTENPQLISEVSSWLGTPHRFGGNTRLGADCSGFVQEVYRLIYQVSLPRSSSNMAQHTQKIGKSQLQEGDLVFFRTSGGRKISHVGIYLSNNKFIHVSSTRGVIVSDLAEPYYVRTFAHGGRVR